MTSFSFVKRYKETVFYGFNTSAANEFLCIDGYNATSNVIVPSKGVPELSLIQQIMKDIVKRLLIKLL
jgi:hypothetical protein